MDDPNIISNSSGFEVDPTDLASVSSPKKAIVLGVVNTSGMKSSSVIRKRRWDQPPDESGETPCLKKVHLNQPYESPESSSFNSPAERISEKPFDASDQCDVINSDESGNALEQVLHCEPVINEESAMLIDLPPDAVCERLGQQFTDNSLDNTVNSELSKCESTVAAESVAKNSDSVSDAVNSLSLELRLSDTTQDKDGGVPLEPVSDNTVVVKSEKKVKTSTVLSHQSDELRRIMFSYNEGTSDSDTSESNVPSPSADDNKIVKDTPGLIESKETTLSETCKNVQNPNSSETRSPIKENSVASDEKLIKENNIPDNFEENHEQVSGSSRKPSNEVQDLEPAISNFDSKSESQLNIPSPNEHDLSKSSEVNNVDHPSLNSLFGNSTNDIAPVKNSDSSLEVVNELTASKRYYLEGEMCNEITRTVDSSKNLTKMKSTDDDGKVIEINCMKVDDEVIVNNIPADTDDSLKDDLSKNDDSSDLPVTNENQDSEINLGKVPGVDSESLIESAGPESMVISESKEGTPDVSAPSPKAEMTSSANINEGNVFNKDGSINVSETQAELNIFDESNKCNNPVVIENSLDINTSSVDGEISSTIKLDVREVLAHDEVGEYKTDAPTKTVDDSKNDSKSIPLPIKAGNIDTERMDLCHSGLDKSAISPSNTEKSTSVNTTESSQFKLFNNSLGVTSEIEHESKQSICKVSANENLLSVDNTISSQFSEKSPCSVELPSAKSNESDKSCLDVEPSNNIDPEVMKVIFGTTDESTGVVSCLQDEDVSNDPSSPDSECSNTKNVVSKESRAEEVSSIAINSAEQLEETSENNSPKSPAELIKSSSSNVTSDLSEIENVEQNYVESVAEETIVEEKVEESILLERKIHTSLVNKEDNIPSVAISNVDNIDEAPCENKNIEMPVKVISLAGDLDLQNKLSEDSKKDNSEAVVINEKCISEDIDKESSLKNTNDYSGIINNELTKVNAFSSVSKSPAHTSSVLCDDTSKKDLKTNEDPPIEVDEGDILSSSSPVEFITKDKVDILKETTPDLTSVNIDAGSPETASLFEEKVQLEETESVGLLGDSNLGFEDSIVSEEIDASSKHPAIINETALNNNEDLSKVITQDIESFDVIEEVVTCATVSSDKVDAIGVEEVTNEDENAQFATEEVLEETQESVESSVLEAVIDDDTSDVPIPDTDNQNIVIESVYINADKNSLSEVADKHVSVGTKLNEKEFLSNSISKKTLPEKMECESPVNSINKAVEASSVESMEVDESPDEVHDSKSSGESAFSSVISTVKSDSKVLKEKSPPNVPLLKTVSSPVVQSKEFPNSSKIEIPVGTSSETVQNISARLEPITLKIYKDNLSIKTDELDSPKKHKSPKLPSDSRVQHSPHSISSERASSMSPQNKQFEYTLKIAKDANTNIPKATMSPKRNLSPSSSWKLESGSLSPRSPGETGIGTLKFKLTKPASSFSNDINPSSSTVTINKKSPLSSDNQASCRLGPREDEVKESTSLPKQPLEMGSALKMMMEGDKTESRLESSSILEQVLSSSSNDGANSSKKRGRPRKPIDENEVLPLNHSPPPGGGEGDPESPTLDISGETSEPGSSRQVRSCRARTQPIVARQRKSRGGANNSTPATPRGGGRGGARGVARPIATAEEAEKIQEKLSEKEKAELAKIEARKEKMRLDRIAKNEAKKAKKLAKKLKDEERRKRMAAEKAEKAAAAAPQVFEEETRMSASESRGHTPAPLSRLMMQSSEGMDESQSSITMSTPKTGNHKGRMEIPIDPESDEVKVEQLAEYMWQGSELCMIQEQVSNYLGVKSFKRKYPDLKRRLVEAEERTFLEDSGLVPKSMCDLGLTAVSSAEILDIMFQDFPDKYEEFRQYVRDKQAREMSFKQKALASQTQNAKAKGELRELALEAAAMWNSNLNRERREERRCALDLQTFTVNYPKQDRERMVRNPLRPGLYPVAVIPGQFSDYYKTYTPTELMYFPLNTVMYGPLKPNERRDGSDSSSSSSDESSGTSSDSEEDDEENIPKECKICNGEKKTNSETHPEILLQCSNCKGLCHPTCQEITPEMLPHIKKYSWHCSNCKQCVKCKNTSKEEKMLFCDLCDRGYHLSCVGLRKSPEGRWHCSVCSFCTICGSKDPGGPEWFYEYKKTDKGVRLYQRTLCAPCSKNALM